MFVYETWGEKEKDNERYAMGFSVAGWRLLAHKEQLRKFLCSQGLDLIIEVEVTRRERENQRYASEEEKERQQKEGSTDSIGSTAELLLKSPKDILALGQAIVRELELDDRGAVLERWLAHHLAELMSEADREVGPTKAAAEQQAVDLILRLWMHRRVLPEPVDPLGGYRDAIAVLGRLMPEADPWARYRRHGSYKKPSSA